MDWRTRLHSWVESPRAQAGIVGLILLNALTLGLGTAPDLMTHIGTWVRPLDMLILMLFSLEITVKLISLGRRFWADPWNVFDFVVVAVALIPASGPIAVLRVLRLLRLVRMVPKLRYIVEALLHAIPGIISIAGLLLLVFYVFAIIATSLFGHSHPQWFGSLGASLYSLFQVMTLESWSMGIARPVMQTHPWAWAFFVPFILVSTFTVLNLFIAIMVDAMQSIEEQQLARTEAHLNTARRADQQQLHADLAALSEQMAQMQQRLQRLQDQLQPPNSTEA